MQRVTQSVDSSNVCTHSIERLLADLTPPPPVNRQTLPLLSEHTQTTATDYMNQDPIPVLSAHRYANTPFDSNYQTISTNMSLPPLPTYVNVPTHVNAPLSQAAYPPPVGTLYADRIQPQPIAVGQPGRSAFSRVDAPQNQPIAVDPAVQYAICTLASADHVRPTVTAHMAPLQSPAVHWRKRLAYDYVQPDTGLGAPTHAAPAIHSGYIRPQISDTHTHTLK